MTIDNIGRANCSGCSLCSLVCPQASIVMREDEEGFIAPIIDDNTCVNCGLCYQMCPCNVKQSSEITPLYYAAAIKDEGLLKHSSSGGMFIALATAFIHQGGFVCGCVFNEKMQAVHVVTDRLEEVEKMMGSKYVQSSITESLCVVKNLLQEGKKVLFTGTACQIAAVKKYTKNGTNLFCVDILCHGVPSPLYLKKYVDYLETKHRGRVSRLEFRNKEKRGWGSEHRTYYEIDKNGTIKGYRPNLPSYFCAFFWGLNLRESCYHCKFTGTNRISDITIGDFWGYWSYFKKEFPQGISIMSINSPKGSELLDLIKDAMEYLIEVPQKDALGTNTNFYHPTEKPSTRDGFYKGIRDMRYQDFRKRVFCDKTSKKKFLVSVYGCYIPERIKKLIRSVK